MAETGKPDYILEPRYILELYFARTGTKVRVDDPALINDEIIASAWSMMNDFVTHGSLIFGRDFHICGAHQAITHPFSRETRTIVSQKNALIL